MDAAKDHDRGKIDEAGYPVLDGGDVTAILESVDQDEMPFLIKSVERLQELQGLSRADMRTSQRRIYVGELEVIGKYIFLDMCVLIRGEHERDDLSGYPR